MRKLSKLNAPQLTLLSIVNNEIDQNDFIEFVEEFDFERFPFFSQIETSVKMNELNNMRMKSIVDKKISKRQITITFDEYRLKMDNKA